MAVIFMASYTTPGDTIQIVKPGSFGQREQHVNFSND